MGILYTATEYPFILYNDFGDATKITDGDHLVNFCFEVFVHAKQQADAMKNDGIKGVGTVKLDGVLESLGAGTIFGLNHLYEPRIMQMLRAYQVYQFAPHKAFKAGIWGDVFSIIDNLKPRMF